MSTDGMTVAVTGPTGTFGMGTGDGVVTADEVARELGLAPLPVRSASRSGAVVVLAPTMQ